MPEREVARSAQTGQFVSDEYAHEHPDVTVTETVHTPEPGTAGDDGPDCGDAA